MSKSPKIMGWHGIVRHEIHLFNVISAKCLPQDVLIKAINTDVRTCQGNDLSELNQYIMKFLLI